MFLKKRGISRRKGCGKRKGWLIHIFALCLLNFRGVQNGCHQDFKYLMVSIHFFIKWESNERFMPDKLQSLEENVFWFFFTSANFTGKHLCWSLFLIKLHTLRSATLLKRDSKKIFKNAYFEEHLRTNASNIYFEITWMSYWKLTLHNLY